MAGSWKDSFPAVSWTVRPSLYEDVRRILVRAGEGGPIRDYDGDGGNDDGYLEQQCSYHPRAQHEALYCRD